MGYNTTMHSNKQTNKQSAVVENKMNCMPTIFSWQIPTHVSLADNFTYPKTKDSRIFMAT